MDALERITALIDLALHAGALPAALSGPVRYDHCWATPEIHVERIDYVQEAFRYSDHAAIVADLNFDPNSKRAVRIPIDDIEPEWMGQPAIQIDDSDLDTLWGGVA